VRGYHARRAGQQARTLARGRLRALALDGKTSREARRADGTRVHLLGAAEHGTCWTISRPASSTTRPATSLSCWNLWTWMVPW
jgi:hypothetical protein